MEITVTYRRFVTNLEHSKSYGLSVENFPFGGMEITVNYRRFVTNLEHSKSYGLSSCKSARAEVAQHFRVGVQVRTLYIATCVSIRQ